jgi:hypothetical protein
MQLVNGEFYKTDVFRLWNERCSTVSSNKTPRKKLPDIHLPVRELIFVRTPSTGGVPG